MPVLLVAYDPDWARRFELERASLEEVLEPWLSGGIHHVGSTAITGLAAKPILDLLAGVHDLPEAAAAVEPLRRHGYVHASHRPEALWFYQPPSDWPDQHTHHLHLTEPGSDLWCERLGFRDALRADPALAADYQVLKTRLAGEYPDHLPAYTAGKRAFVADVLASIGINLADPAQRAADHVDDTDRL